jgi:RNA polymerase sigma-70 factor, ECF subfamily
MHLAAHIQTEDETWMKAFCTSNDAFAFEQLYNRYARKLAKFCYRMLNSTEQAEDIVHEVFAKLIENPKAFDTTQRFSTWIYTIAHRLCLNAIRNSKTRQRLLELHYDFSTTTFTHFSLDAQLLKQKINNLYKTLSQKEQCVFILRFEHEMSIKEIAEIAEIPEGSVKSCIFYVLKKMKAELQPYLIK